MFHTFGYISIERDQSMALTLKPTYNISITLQDRDWNKSTMSCHVPATAALATVETFITGTLIPAVQGISNAVVLSWSLTRHAEDNAVVADAEEVSDVERKGVFSFRAVDGSAYVVNVPSLINEVVIDRTNLIDIGDALVVAFLDAMTAGITGALPSTYLASDLVRIDHARKHHRGSRRG
jgi:hypothetical protein